jgi:hypothetical protein
VCAGARVRPGGVRGVGHLDRRRRKRSSPTGRRSGSRGAQVSAYLMPPPTRRPRPSTPARPGVPRGGDPTRRDHSSLSDAADLPMPPRGRLRSPDSAASSAEVRTDGS